MRDLSLGPLLPTFAGHDATVFCDWTARCEDRDERACLLESANTARSVMEPSCLACMERERGCDEVYGACQRECWPEPEPEPFWVPPTFAH